MANLKLYNSLFRQKEIFKPIDPAHVRLYACGPTVYSYAHIGNARMAVVFDVLRRVLKASYPRVTHVSNITDIEDKIIDAARAAGVPTSEITKKYGDMYNQDMAALGVQLPDVQPLATTHVPEMIALIETLIQNGAAYEKDGHVLFNVPAYASYGVLSRRSRDEQIAGARVEVAPYKKDPADFVLWKPSTGDQPGWDSPWGYGRPGWHIECSAMAEKHLGLPFDIHGGGADLKFPHHENEIAQSCAAHHIAPEDFARMWVHNGFLTVEGEKMSKSIGNVKLVHDLIETIKPEVIRLCLLNAHYRQPLDWSENLVAQTTKTLDKFYGLIKDVHVQMEDIVIPEEITAPLYDDLNVPGFIAALNTWLKTQNDPVNVAGVLKKAGALIGILQDDPAAWFQTETHLSADEVSKIEGLLQERTQARRDKNFARADEIRAELGAMGIEIEDTPQGPKWVVAA